MAAVTANQLVTRQEGVRSSAPVGALVTIYGGTLVYNDATGYAASDDAAGVNAFLGIAIDKADNSAGADGDIDVELWVSGDFELVGAGFTQGTVGSDIYGSNNYTVGTSSAGTSYVGRCVGYVSATKIIVRIFPGFDPQNITEVDLDDDEEIKLGTGDDVSILFSTGDASNHAAVIAVDNTSQQLHVTDLAAKATDWNRSAGTHPELSIHSNTTPATDYLAIGNHDGTTATINMVGGTTLGFAIDGTTDFTITANSLNVLTGSGIDLADSCNITFGTGDDVTMDFDGTNLVIATAVADTGALALGADGAGVDVILYGDTASQSATWDQSADDLILTSLVRVVGAGSTQVPCIPVAAQQTLAAGGGAVTITEYYTAGASDAGGDAWTLVDGAQSGQLKKIQLVTDGGGDATLTPTTLTGGTTITFADAGDYCVLMWSGTSWVAIELGNDADGASAPVLA